MRDAFRRLSSTPLVSAVAVLSLALGIGANTTLFSILNSLLLKPLPVRDPHTLVALASGQPGEDAAMTYPVWREVRDRRILPDAFVWATDRVNVGSLGETRTLDTVWASGRFFDMLGIQAIAGRTFGEADDRRDGGPHGPVAVITYAMWQRVFGGDRGIVGRTLTLERTPYTIVGVAPRGFFGLDVGGAADVILPLETEPMLGRVPPRGARWPWLHITARLPPGASIESATAAMQGAQPQIREATMPAFDRVEDREAYLRGPWTMRSAATGSSGLRGRYGDALIALIAIAALVLLVACTNIANLQMARTAARRHELSVRVALGASRRRIAGQLIAESLLLSAIGAGLGLAIAAFGAPLVVRQLTTWARTAFLDLTPDWRVLALTAGTMLATTALFGLVPALRGARVDPIEALNQKGRGGTTGRSGVSNTLIMLQVTVSLVLLAGAGLFLRSFTALTQRDLGFDRSRVVITVIDARRSAVAPAERLALYERIREAVAGLPGVESAAASMATPLGSAGVRLTRDVTIPDAAGAIREARIFTTPVSPDWFRTFGTRLLAGRDFDASDRATAPHVAIVNETFAARYLGGANPVGRTVLAGSGDAARQPIEIVGLVQDAAFVSVRDALDAIMYRPLSQSVEENLLKSVPSISISVRAAGDLPPGRLTATVSGTVASVDPDLAVAFQTVSEQLSTHYIRERLLALVSGYFGALAVLLAAVGLYGVTTHAVSRKRAEIGIRMAIGAAPAAVVRLVVGRVALICAAGIISGLAVCLLASRLVQGLLFGTAARDPSAIAGAAALLAAICCLASWLPARRAARINPAEALRES